MRSGYQLGRKNGAVQAEQTSVELDHACLSPSFYYNVSIIFKMSQQTLPFITLISRFARCNSSGRPGDVISAGKEKRPGSTGAQSGRATSLRTAGLGLER